MDDINLSKETVAHVISHVPTSGRFAAEDVMNSSGRSRSTVNMVLKHLRTLGYVKLFSSHGVNGQNVWTTDGCLSMPTPEQSSKPSRQQWRRESYQDVVDAIRSGDPGWVFTVAKKQARTPTAILQMINVLEAFGVTIEDIGEALDDGVVVPARIIDFAKLMSDRLAAKADETKRAAEKIRAEESPNPVQMKFDDGVPPVTRLLEQVAALTIAIKKLGEVVTTLTVNQAEMDVRMRKSISNGSIAKNQGEMNHALLADMRKEEVAHYKTLYDQVGFLAGQLSTLMVSLGVNRARS